MFLQPVNEIEIALTLETLSPLLIRGNDDLPRSVGPIGRTN